jgi:group I intron endonuclease
MARIYLVTNKLNGKQYVGQTVTEHSRHGHGHAIKRAYKKHGFNNFTYEHILSNVEDTKFLDFAEQFWIKVFNSLAPNGYNIESGGRWGKRTNVKTNLGKKASPEVRAKMSEGQKRYLAGLDVHHNTGKKHSEETKAKMRTARAKRVYTEEDKLKISNAVKEWHKKRKEQKCL